MASGLSAPPVLSTPDNHILSETEPAIVVQPTQRLSEEQVLIRYEIDRTVREIRKNRWKRVALQFPDHMLPDSARVYQLLARGLKEKNSDDSAKQQGTTVSTLAGQVQDLQIQKEADDKPTKLTILGDTSYGSCCVDEIAAEHVDADAVVHYGRSCLSPTARLPVIYVFTKRNLNHEAVCEAFMETFPEKNSKVILTADIPFADHVEHICSILEAWGYSDIFAASIIHDPSSLVPNRTLPQLIMQDRSQLGDWHLFHISDPPTSLLLTLSSRMKDIHIYPTASDGDAKSAVEQASTSMILRRRYALVTSLSTVSTWGILINTLSVKDYLHIVDYVRQQIADAGKKSYLFVVGKLNAAKVANFAEIGGWVVIGCWESSLIDSRDFFKPIITPFELDLVLAGDVNRVWTGEWRGDFQVVLDKVQNIDSKFQDRSDTYQMPGTFVDEQEGEHISDGVDEVDSEEESAPPEFDLRTGRYVSHTRPMATRRAMENTRNGPDQGTTSTAIARRAKGELLAVNGVVSPAAEYLAQKRTWRGLGSDFEIKYDDEEEEQGGLIEEGRSGVAKGYTVGESTAS